MVLIVGIVGVVVVVAVAAALVAVRRWVHDDEHSVQDYHRQLHTLEVLRVPDSAPARAAAPRPAPLDHFPVSAVRVAGPAAGGATTAGTTAAGTTAGGTTVGGTRVGGATTTGPATADPAAGGPAAAAAAGPPVPPPEAGGEAATITFDDTAAGPEPVPRSFMTGTPDPAILAINHRPRRLAGPLAALAVVAVIVTVLVVAGFHSTTPSHGRSAGAPPTPPAAGPAVPPPVLSGPEAASAHRAEYRVAVHDYALTLSAPGTGSCPVAAGVPARRVVLYSATLTAGQAHTVTARGTVTVVAGTVDACAVSVNGSAVVLPPRARSPFVFVFRPAATG